MVEVTVRCCGPLGLTDPDAVDILLECLTEAPYWVPESSDGGADVGGYKRNGISRRRRYDLAQPRYAVGDTALVGGTLAGDQEDYEEKSNLLYSHRLFVVKVEYNGAQHPRRGPGGFLWATGEFTSPIEVVRADDSVADERTSFRWTIALEDAWPTVGPV